MQEWVEKELEESDLGDERLNDRFKLLLDGLSKKPSLSIPAALGGWAETCAAYRFFDNEQVKPENVLSPHREATLKRMQGEEVILLAQDTTEIDLTRREERVSGSGPLNEETRFGFYSHVMLAFTPERVPLGVVSELTWGRDMEKFLFNRGESTSERDKKRKQEPIEAKESFRWLAGYREGCKVASELPGTKVVVISDREGDIFESFVERENKAETSSAYWITRARHNRRLSSEEGSESWGSLSEEVASSEVVGEIDIEVSKNRPKRADEKRRKKLERTARVTRATVQATTVSLRGPHRPGGALPDTEVNAILVTEKKAPKGEKRIQWLLLTNLPIKDFEQVCKVIEYYACRWQIEIFFRTLKSGCKIEELQLETADRFKPCLALYMIIAWRVMFVTMLGRECPDIPCDAIFEEAEWMSVYAVVKQKKPPKKAPRLEEMVAMIASLGGHLGRKGDGPPGPKTMWIGMQQVPNFAQGWITFGPGSKLKQAICV